MTDLGIAVYKANDNNLSGWWFKHLTKFATGSDFYHLAPYIGKYQLEINPYHPSRWVSKEAIARLPQYTSLVDVPLVRNTNLSFIDFNNPRWVGLSASWPKMVLHYKLQSEKFFGYDCFQLSREFAMQFYPDALSERWDLAGWVADLIHLGDSNGS